MVEISVEELLRLCRGITTDNDIFSGIDDLLNLPEVDMRDIPQWANWWAWDLYGTFEVYQQKPEISCNVLYSKYRNRVIEKYSVPFEVPNWRYTLYRIEAHYVKEWPEIDEKDIPNNAQWYAWDDIGRFSFYETRPICGPGAFHYEDNKISDYLSDCKKYDLSYRPLNWHESLHKIDRKKIPIEIWNAIEVLCGPEYKWVAMDKDKRVYAYKNIPRINSNMIWDIGIAGKHVLIPVLENFFPNWKTSLRRKPE